MRTRTDSRDITRSFHQGDIFSHMAHKSIINSKAALRAKVIRYVYEQGMYGATSDEVEEALGLSHQSISARITEAKADGTLIPNGMKRKTRSGRNAAVLITKGVSGDWNG
jgi:DNA-binding transcriptional regulator LsrR (DeoR family)